MSTISTSFQPHFEELEEARQYYLKQLDDPECDKKEIEFELKKIQTEFEYLRTFQGHIEKYGKEYAKKCMTTCEGVFHKYVDYNEHIIDIWRQQRDGEPVDPQDLTEENADMLALEDACQRIKPLLENDD